MSPTPSQVGQRIKTLRERRGLSQAALAAKVKITREYVNKLEAGRYDPTLGVLQRLAKALRISLTEMLEPYAGGTQVDRAALIRRLTRARTGFRQDQDVLEMLALADEVEKLGVAYRGRAKDLRTGKNIDMHLTQILDDLNPHR